MDAWFGLSNTSIRFVPPQGTSFLALVAVPTAQSWQFDSVLEVSPGDKYQSLHIDSLAPEELTDAQMWCSSGYGISLPRSLRIESTNVSWAVYLVSAAGVDAVPDSIASALQGYYSNCPQTPPIDDLRVEHTWNSAEGLSSRSLEFTGNPPFYFLGLKFQPDEPEWYFASTNISGDWRAAGPMASSSSGEKIDFTATCPSSPGLHHLDVEASGGRRTVYLIEASEQAGQ